MRKRNVIFLRVKFKSRLPICLLHEGVAEVVEAGKGTTLEVRAKVVVNPMIPCGECYAYKSGREFMPKLEIYGCYG